MRRYGLTWRSNGAITVGPVTTAYSDTVPAGDVISQGLTAGASVAQGTPVDLVVSLGVQMVTVPDLDGPAAEAETKLSDAGLVTGTAGSDYSDTVAEGDVISQSPAAGTEVEIGSAVDYVASLGVQMVTVAIRRVNLGQTDEPTLLDYIDTDNPSNLS